MAINYHNIGKCWITATVHVCKCVFDMKDNNF